MCPQKHYAEVVVKFSKFQRPAEFEPKLSHVKRELDGIQERIHLLEVPSADPTALQERHDACMVGAQSGVTLVGCVLSQAACMVGGQSDVTLVGWVVSEA